MSLEQLPERIATKIVIQAETGCWLWTAGRNSTGYPSIWWNRKRLSTHRVIYELIEGAIPEGLDLDHLCRVRHCVNPAHLEPVTHRENCLRGFGSTGNNARKTHCPEGHPYDEDNTYYVPASHGRHRQCRTCNSRRNAEKRAETARRRAAA